MALKLVSGVPAKGAPHHFPGYGPRKWNDQMHIRGEMTSGKLTVSGFVRSRLGSLWWFEVDFWPRSVHFRRGPPTIFRKHMPSGMGTESLGVIGCIFAENGPLEGGIEASFWGTGWGAKGVRYSFSNGTHTIFRKHMPWAIRTESWEWSDAYWPKGDFRVDFWPRSVHFRRGPPTIFRKHMPSGMGTESLRVIGCIFAENGPLEGGIESSFWGTGWGAKGDFMRYSYLYPYIFESRTHTFFESTCPELYAQQSWEWSDAYSWRNDLWKVNCKRVCEKPAGVLMVIWSGFLAPIRSFSKGAPHHFPKAHALRYGHRKFGSDWMYIRGEWALRRWHWS